MLKGLMNQIGSNTKNLLQSESTKASQLNPFDYFEQ